MYLTRDEVLGFSAEEYQNVGTISRAIFDRYACGIDPETAKRIIADYQNEYGRIHGFV